MSTLRGYVIMIFMGFDKHICAFVGHIGISFVKVRISSCNTVSSQDKFQENLLTERNDNIHKLETKEKMKPKLFSGAIKVLLK